MLCAISLLLLIVGFNGFMQESFYSQNGGQSGDVQSRPDNHASSKNCYGISGEVGMLRKSPPPVCVLSVEGREVALYREILDTNDTMFNDLISVVDGSMLHSVVNDAVLESFSDNRLGNCGEMCMKRISPLPVCTRSLKGEKDLDKMNFLSTNSIMFRTSDTLIDDLCFDFHCTCINCCYNSFFITDSVFELLELLLPDTCSTVDIIYGIDFYEFPNYFFNFHRFSFKNNFDSPHIPYLPINFNYFFETASISSLSSVYYHNWKIIFCCKRKSRKIILVPGKYFWQRKRSKPKNINQNSIHFAFKPLLRSIISSRFLSIPINFLYLQKEVFNLSTYRPIICIKILFNSSCYLIFILAFKFKYFLSQNFIVAEAIEADRIIKPSSKMLFIVGLDGRSNIMNYDDECLSVQTIINYISHLHNLNDVDFYITYNSKTLDGNKGISHYGITSHSTIRIMLRLKGGMHNKSKSSKPNTSSRSSSDQIPYTPTKSTPKVESLKKELNTGEDEEEGSGDDYVEGTEEVFSESDEEKIKGKRVKKRSEDTDNIHNRQQLESMQKQMELLSQMLQMQVKQNESLRDELGYLRKMAEDDKLEIKTLLLNLSNSSTNPSTSSSTSTTSTTSNTSTTSTASTTLTTPTTPSTTLHTSATIANYTHHISLSKGMSGSVLNPTLNISFNIEKEVKSLFGDVVIDKAVKDLIFKDLEVYNLNRPFDEWWKDFKFAIRSAGLKSRRSQICYSFIQYMDPTIKKYFKDLTVDDDLTLEGMITIVLSLYDKGSKTTLEYEKELLSIIKASKETTAAYYLRLLSVASKAQVTDKEKIKHVYVQGLTPQAFYRSVINEIENDTSLEVTHQIALKLEEKFIQALKHENLLRATNNFSENPKEINNQNIQKNKNFNNQKQQVVKNASNEKKIENNSKDSPSIGKKVDPICRICKKEHDFRECVKKYQYYSFAEARLLKKIGREPTKRESHPKPEDRLTENTPWIKNALAKVASSPNQKKV